MGDGECSCRWSFPWRDRPRLIAGDSMLCCVCLTSLNSSVNLQRNLVRRRSCQPRQPPPLELDHSRHMWHHFWNVHLRRDCARDPPLHLHYGRAPIQCRTPQFRNRGSCSCLSSTIPTIHIGSEQHLQEANALQARPTARRANDLDTKLHNSFLEAPMPLLLPPLPPDASTRIHNQTH